MTSPSEALYSSVPDDDIEGYRPEPKASLSDAGSHEAFLEHAQVRPRKSRRRNLWPWIAHSIFFSISCLVLLQGIRLLRQGKQSCVAKLSTYSPALDAVSDDYQVVRFNGTFGRYSPYTEPPSDETDAAWGELVEGPVFSASEEDMDRIGADRDSVRLPPESGGGYYATLEVFHQMHCLNVLWQSTYLEYYKEKNETFGQSDRVVRTHLDHCVTILRQKLACDADINVVTYNWVHNIQYPFPNANTLHKCRNFDTIMDWAKAHQADDPIGGVVLKPEGAKEWRHAP
ncbi:MAG: hypothetical protein M4579_003888 [Chaenotheca gracillima]|nr:MAG: hypothetical protein M4579_003888 [Chaenotheca gracillima]